MTSRDWDAAADSQSPFHDETFETDTHKLRSTYSGGMAAFDGSSSIVDADASIDPVYKAKARVLNDAVFKSLLV